MGKIYKNNQKSFITKDYSSFSKYLSMILFVILFTNSSRILGQLSVSTNFANNNGSSAIIFTFYNSNAFPVNINSIGTYAGTTGTKTVQLWTKPVTGFGQATSAAVNTTNGWTLQTTQTVVTTANTTATVGATAPLVLTGISVAIPANSYYLLCVSFNAGLRYSTLGTQNGIFTSDGCTINCTAGNGFGGTLTAPTNTPRCFIGVVNFSPGWIPSPLDMGANAFVKPLSSKTCFGNDTLVVRVINHGTSSIDYSVNSTTLTAVTTGPVPSSYSLALTSGTLASGATQDYTLSTTYNLSNLGTYKLKAYTTLSGDGTPLNDTTITTITKSPNFTKSFAPNDSVCRSVPVQLNANYVNTGVQVGNGTLVNTSTGYPAPYGNWYESARHQFLFLASELTAAGVTPGNISAITFNATNLNGSDPYTNFNIALATTTLTSITAFQTTGFVTHFSAPSYTPVLGINNHTFSTPFVWNGTDNIIIETCYDNTLTGFSNNVSILQTTTPFTSSVYHYDDGDPTLCSSPVISSTMSRRPNVSFVQPKAISYTWTPSIGLSATNISNPISTLSSSNTYTVAVDVDGCLTYDTLHVHIKPTPLPSLGADTLLCNVPYVLNTNTAADSYLWNNGVTTPTLNATVAGKYWVRGTNSNGCIASDTINITIGQTPIVTLGPDTAFCQNKSIVLYAGNPGSTYLWNTGATTSTLAVSTVGTYSVVVTNSTACKSSDIVNVTVKSNPTVSLVFTGQTVFCPTQSGRLLNEGVPSGGTYIGAGVTGGNVFNANQAGQGSYIILYNYTAPNGCSSIAKDTLKVNACVGIEELTNDVALNVYPNPNTGLFTMELNTSSDIDARIHVMSIDSRIVYEDVITGNGLITKTIDISPLANGIYYLRLETKDVVKTFKILKQ